MATEEMDDFDNGYDQGRYEAIVAMAEFLGSMIAKVSNREDRLSLKEMAVKRIRFFAQGGDHE